MEMYKQASRIGLRVETTKGSLSVEQLWTLSLTNLANIIKNVKKTLKIDNDDELSFLDETKTIDSTTQLTFDILKDIYLTKKNEQEKLREDALRKVNNEKIMALIHAKQEAKLSDMSIEDLQKMLQ
jgi:hypothetical protein